MSQKSECLRITKKKLSNKRFRKSEEAILMAVFSSNKNQNLKNIMKEIKLSRTTFYRHHGSMNKILADYEKYMILEFKRRIKNANTTSIGLKNLYWQMLVFLTEHKNIVTFSIKQENGKIIENIIKTVKIEPTNCNEIMLKIYQKEVVGLIEIWIKTGFKKEEIEKTLNDILYLTKTINSRLNFFNSKQHN